jgi:hypothetical protein
MGFPDWRETAQTWAERAAELTAEVPSKLERLKDGREVLDTGDIERFREFHHRQGDYPGFKGTCGICSCEVVLRMFGRKVTETQLVKHAIDRGLCDVRKGRPELSGGTTSEHRLRILADFGVRAHREQARSIEDIVEKIENGHGLILALNAHRLNNWPASASDLRDPNHAVSVIGCRSNPATGEILGVIVNDSSGGAARYIDVATLAKCWLRYGGDYEVTDSSYLDSNRS